MLLGKRRLDAASSASKALLPWVAMLSQHPFNRRSEAYMADRVLRMVLLEQDGGVPHRDV